MLPNLYNQSDYGLKMLGVSNISKSYGEQTLFSDVTFNVGVRDRICIIGPNGSGKTTLLMSIMGFPTYQVTGGKIFFKGKDITALPLNERANLGIGISFQRPPTIHGVKTRHMLEIFDKGEEEIKSMAQGLDFEEFLDRDLNDGFSGGEIKRSELLQLMAQNPDFLLLDEPESGVDLENIALIGRFIEELLQKEMKSQDGKSRKELKMQRWKSGLIITHTGYILDYVDADIGHVLMEGELTCSGNPREILKTIKELGYDECVNCCRI